MEAGLEIPVIYQGQELSLPCRIIPAGYSYRIQVTVSGQEILFEPDEEGHYRAVLAATQAEK